MHILNKIGYAGCYSDYSKRPLHDSRVGRLCASVPPGPPIAYLGLVFLHFTDKVHYTPTQLIIWLLIVAVVQVLDYFTPMLGSKYSGGSKWEIGDV